MAKRFVYMNDKNNKVLYDVVVQNHVSPEDVDQRMLRDTGIDPRIALHISKSIRTVADNELGKTMGKTKKRYSGGRR